MKIDRNFLLNLKDPVERTPICLRMHSKIIDYARKDATSRGEKFIDYMTNIMLVKILHDNRGEDFFKILFKGEPK